ncbi:transposase [Anaerospora sp.]|uniref:transposase n=1 Tax=Anaerospora sp. TaxID=1960278 RepID=UPI00289A33C8|nr:transposase [Anaerospora sp.]
MMMPRVSREKSRSGIYHIVLRGINRQDIFHTEEDFLNFLGIVKRVKAAQQFQLYAYCLMRNHIHLLIHEQNEDIAKTMKRIAVSYAGWYNSQYERTGHVFQDRFKSEPVEDHQYLLTVLRYIHNNPVKEYLVTNPEKYRWSSCKEYYEDALPIDEVTDTAYILGAFSADKETGRTLLQDFMKLQDFDQILDIEKRERKSDAELEAHVEYLLDGQPVLRLATMNKQERNSFLQQLKKLKGVTQRQIARVTGLNPNIIFKA